MIGGFNTNVRYRGRMFHVQTEDSGHANPKIVTLLYEGGSILLSKRRSYEDQVSAENLETVVRELMEEQHREMVQALKDGQLEDVVEKRAREASALASGEAAPQAGGRGERVDRFGAGTITDRPLHEVILAHFASAS